MLKKIATLLEVYKYIEIFFYIILETGSISKSYKLKREK